ncbi:MAG: molybdopterin dinucleotide binding domain-containing protein, partial [Nitrospinaceae bacterium]
RDEEPEPTTQESMFSYVRLSDGGLARHPNPRSEVAVISEVARRVQPDGPIRWETLADTHGIRQAIGAVVKGFGRIKDIDRDRREFHVDGRILHEPAFPTANGRAKFHVPTNLRGFHGEPLQGRFCLMTVRSEGQFNTVVYEQQDRFRGVDRRDVVFIHAEDMAALGWTPEDRVTVKNATGELRGQILVPYPIKSGNVMMYYPEANVLVPRTRDSKSQTPSFKSVEVTLEKESSGPPVQQADSPGAAI